MHRALPFLLISFLAVGCSGATKLIGNSDLPPTDMEKRFLLVGKWLGQMPDANGDLQQWLVSRFADGSYRIHLRIDRNDGSLKEQIEVGMWGVSGPIYFTILKGWMKGGQFVPADMENPSFYDAYEILELDSDHMKYRTFGMIEMVLEVKRVADTFEFPAKGP